MLDGMMRRVIDAPLDRAGKKLAAQGVTANGVTLAGLVLGIVAAAILALGGPGWVALLPLLAGRVADGLDGAVARATAKTDFGGYLDIVADFLFYAAIPLAFVLRDPGANGVAGAFLLASFYVNGASFLGYAVLAEKRGMQTRSRGKSRCISPQVCWKARRRLRFSCCSACGLRALRRWPGCSGRCALSPQGRGSGWQPGPFAKRAARGADGCADGRMHAGGGMLAGHSG
jgi:phosphatidylglycerophosphate synthase